MSRPRRKQKYLTCPSREKFLAMKIMKNKLIHFVKRQKHNISKNVRKKILQISNNSAIYLNRV